MWFEQIQRIATLAHARYRNDALLVIAIDGCGGAGKSTLSQALAEQVAHWSRVQVVNLDDFYRPLTTEQQSTLTRDQAQKAYFDVAPYRQNVLEPLTRGIDVTYRPNHWINGEVDQPITLQASGVLIVDGVFSFSESVRSLVSLSVFVDTPLQLRKKRLVQRPQEDIGWVNHWQQTEAWHHHHQNTATAVEFVLVGTADQ